MGWDSGKQKRLREKDEVKTRMEIRAKYRKWGREERSRRASMC